MDKINEVLTRGVEKIYPTKEALEKILRSGKKIRLYQGFDPSMPNLHLGNMVGVLKLKQFQDLGCEVIFLVGDFTGMIGDPTDKSATRPVLTHEQTRKNCESWKQQAGKVLKFDGQNPAKFMFNSEWLGKISFEDLIRITANFTAQQMLERDFFQKRLKENRPIHLNEFLYPVAQAIDCVKMDVDLEVGGSDQTFNMLMGRTLMAALKNKEKFVLATKLLVDAQGNKVGKTAGNALFLNASPADLFGGVMSFPDEVLISAFELLTEAPLQWIKEQEKLVQSGKVNPMDLKKQLALEIVKMYHGGLNARNAEKEFERVFQKRGAPEEAATVRVTAGDWEIVDLLTETKLVSSRSEAKRLIEQGGVDINGEKFKGSKVKVQENMIIKIGKRKFVRVEIK